MNMGHSFFRKFEATSSLMRGNLGTRSKTNRDNFAPRANVSLGMASRPCEKCRRRNELREWCEAQLPGRAFTIGTNKSCHVVGRVFNGPKRPMKIRRVMKPSGVAP
jgi:hypothetical protein